MNMKSAETKTKSFDFASLLIALLGFIFAFFVYEFLMAEEHKLLKAKFHHDGESILTTFEDNVQSKIALAQSLRAFFDASKKVDRTEFRKFTQHFLVSQLGVQNAGWAPRVASEKKETFEAQVRKRGYISFGIWDEEKKTEKKVVPKQYYPILYIEPYEDNEWILGVDLAADPLRRKALMEAKEKDSLALTHSFHRDYDFQLLSFVPVYNEKQIEGFVFSAINVADIFETVLKSLFSFGMNFIFVDETDAQHKNLLYVYWGGQRQTNPDVYQNFDFTSVPFFYKRKIEMGNRLWAVYCLPTDAYLSLMKAWFAWLGGGAVLVIGIVLALFVHELIERTRLVQKEVEHRTYELQTSQGALKQEVKEHERARLKLGEAMHELKKMDELKSEFMSSASHELRTPLTSIKGYVSLLYQERVGAINEKQKEFLGFVKDSTNRLHRIVNDLLNLSRIESGQGKEHKEVSLGALVTHETALYQPQAEQKKIHLEASVPSEELKIMGHEDQITEVVGNLISNALKYTPPKGQVRVELEKETDRIILQVRDTGVGIAEEEQQNIFEPFYSIQPEQLERQESTGLGLSLVKKIMDNHKGLIEVVSAPKKGSCFRLVFKI